MIGRHVGLKYCTTHYLPLFAYRYFSHKFSVLNHFLFDNAVAANHWVGALYCHKLIDQG